MEVVPQPQEMGNEEVVVSLTAGEVVALLQAWFIDERNPTAEVGPDVLVLERAEAKLRRALEQAGVHYDDSVGD